MDVRARSCSLFSSFKKGKAFSLRCLSPLCSPAVGGGQAYPLRVGMVSCWLADFGRSSASGFGGREPCGLSPNGGLHSPSGREPHQTGEPRGLSPSGGSFTAKPHVPRAPCAPTARSPGSRGTAPAREPRGPSPSGGRFAANLHVSRAAPRPMGAVWGQGALPLVSRRACRR